MTYEMMMRTLESLGADATYYGNGHVIRVTLEDFDGFDSDWSEVFRDYDDEEAVESFLRMLEEESTSSEGDFYEVYHFDGFDVCLGYASYDI